ncbi:extracellular solute-binding protein [Kineosporia babensis]
MAIGALLAASACTAGGSSAPSTTIDPQEKVTLNFTWWGDASRAERYEKAIDLFEAANPNVTVKTSFSAFADYWTARNTEAASRTLPDVFQMDLAYLAEYGGFGHVAPLEDYLGGLIDVDAVDPALVEAGKVEGKTVAVTTSSSTMAVMLNEPLLKTLGVEVPDADMTWDEWDAFLARAGAAGAGSDPEVYGGVDYTAYFWLFQIWLGQQGLAFVEDGRLGFEPADLARWFSRSPALNDSRAVMPPERKAQLDGVDALGIAEVSADINWANFLPRFAEGPASPELSLLLPPHDEGQDTGLFLKPGLMLSIGANSDHPANAAQLVDFLLNDPEVAGIFGMSRGAPASKTATEGIEANSLDEKILDYQDQIAGSLDGTAPPAVKGLGTMEQTFVTVADELAYGRTSPQEAADRWFAEAEIALG